MVAIKMEMDYKMDVLKTVQDKHFSNNQVWRGNL